MQLNKVAQEIEMNAKKFAELEERLDTKERDYLSKRLTCEVYEDQLKKMLKIAEESEDVVDNRLSIERFQLEIKQFSRELPKLKSQMDAIRGRIEFFKQRKQELATMRAEYKRLEHEVQLALEEKILIENEFNRITTCRDIIRNIYKCRSTNDLPQKIFYSLPLKSKRSDENGSGKYKS
jgi:chromosome segregation ATPase